MKSPVSSSCLEDLRQARHEGRHYSELSQVTDIDSLKRYVLTEVRKLGLSDYWFLPLQQVGIPAGRVSSLPEGLFDAYRQLSPYDLLVDYAKQQTRPIYASILYDYCRHAPFDCGWVRGMQDIQALHASYGYYDYYCLFLRGLDGLGSGMFALSSRYMAGAELRACLTGKEIALQVLAGVIEAVGREKFPRIFPTKETRPALSGQPLNVLSAYANSDMNISQLADKLSISAVTVHHHITAARKALGARTNIGAIKKGLQLGLLELQEY